MAEGRNVQGRGRCKWGEYLGADGGVNEKGRRWNVCGAE